MIKTPCEIILWRFLPAIRREIIKAMIMKGVKRKRIAKIFEISEAAISQYMKSKRGSNFKFSKGVMKEFDISAEKIASSKNKKDVIFEICNLCSMLRKRKILCRLHIKENPFLKNCDLYKTICSRNAID